MTKDTDGAGKAGQMHKQTIVTTVLMKVSSTRSCCGHRVEESALQGIWGGGFRKETMAEQDGALDRWVGAHHAQRDVLQLRTMHRPVTHEGSSQKYQRPTR